MDGCGYNAQGYLVCNQTPKTKQISPNVEHFADAEKSPSFIQCSTIMNHADATKNCPTCCIKNGLIWNNRWTNNSNRSFCQCTDHPTMNLLNDTNIIASPAMLSQMSAHVWGLGNMSILDCANYCADDKNCTFFTLDSNNACWNSDLNPVLAQKTFKSGIISGIKK